MMLANVGQLVLAKGGTEGKRMVWFTVLTQPPSTRGSWGYQACCKSDIIAHKGVKRYGQNQPAGLSGPGVLVTVPETASIGRILA